MLGNDLLWGVGARSLVTVVVAASVKAVTSVFSALAAVNPLGNKCAAAGRARISINSVDGKLFP